MSLALRPAEENPRGTGRPCGQCCVTQPIKERRVLAKRSMPRGKRSHAFCVSTAVFLPAAVVPVNGLGRNGSRYLSLLSSGKIPFLLPRNVWKETNSSLPVIQRNPRCCKDFWCVANAAMPSIELLPGPPGGNSTTIVVWVPTITGTLTAASVRTVRSARITLMTWYGSR